MHENLVRRTALLEYIRVENEKDVDHLFGKLDRPVPRSI